MLAHSLTVNENRKMLYDLIYYYYYYYYYYYIINIIIIVIIINIIITIINISLSMQSKIETL